MNTLITQFKTSLTMSLLAFFIVSSCDKKDNDIVNSSSSEQFKKNLSEYLKKAPKGYSVMSKKDPLTGEILFSYIKNDSIKYHNINK